MEQILQALCCKGYATDGAKFPTSRPDRTTVPLVTRTGIPVVAKLYPSGEGEITYANMQGLWRSSFGERRRPPGLPRPIDYLPDVGVLIMERIEGRPLAELGTLDKNILDESVRLVSSLHESDAQPSMLRDFQRIVRSERRKVQRVDELAPKFAGYTRAVVEALEAVQVKDLELVPCHGDFSPRNVLVAPDRLVLIDWDRFQRADPARDIGYIGAWGWVSALRPRGPPDWCVLDQVIAMYNSPNARASIETRLSFHVAAGLVHIAHSLVEWWPADASLVPQLATEALRQLHQLR